MRRKCDTYFLCFLISFSSVSILRILGKLGVLFPEYLNVQSTQQETKVTFCNVCTTWSLCTSRRKRRHFRFSDKKIRAQPGWGGGVKIRFVYRRSQSFPGEGETTAEKWALNHRLKESSKPTIYPPTNPSSYIYAQIMYSIMYDFGFLLPVGKNYVLSADLIKSTLRNNIRENRKGVGLIPAMQEITGNCPRNLWGKFLNFLSVAAETLNRVHKQKFCKTWRQIKIIVLKERLTVPTIWFCIRQKKRS